MVHRVYKFCINILASWIQRTNILLIVRLLLAIVTLLLLAIYAVMWFDVYLYVMLEQWFNKHLLFSFALCFYCFQALVVVVGRIDTSSIEPTKCLFCADEYIKQDFVRYVIDSITNKGVNILMQCSLIAVYVTRMTCVVSVRWKRVMECIIQLLIHFSC